MTNKKILVLGCSAAAFVALVVAVIIVLFVIHASQDVEGVAISVTGPPDVAVGDTFEMVVTVANQRPKKKLTVADVDVADEYLAGFTVVSTAPAHRSSEHVPIDNSRSFHFDFLLPPKSSTNFTFTLRAEKTGIFRGDVDVCEGTRFITGMAQTVVKEKP